MTRLTSIFLALLFSTAMLRADLTMEQQSSDTNQTVFTITMLHSNMMRMEQPSNNLVVIANLTTRDSFTLLTNKTYLRRWGSEVKWEMKEEVKFSHGTNEIDNPPAGAVDTGKSESVNGYNAEVYTWMGAFGLKETLWVAKSYPNYNAIRNEIAKLDMFNDTGPHRNTQPILSLLPGMVVKSESEIKGHTVTTTLVSTRLGALDTSLFEVPAGYTAWKRPGTENKETNAPPAH
jgi:hypothetical protein